MPSLFLILMVSSPVLGVLTSLIVWKRCRKEPANPAALSHDQYLSAKFRLRNDALIMASNAGLIAAVLCLLAAALTQF